MIDNRVLLNAQGIDGLGVYENSLKLADTWLERQKNAELANIKRQTQNILDPDSRFAKMIGLAQQSKRSPWLIADIEAEKGAMAQAEIANREKMAGIDKTMSETNKNNATATETMQKAGQARMDISRPVYEVLGMSGNINMAKSYLENARASGAIDDDTYQSHISQLDLWQGLSPEEIKAVSFAMAKGQLDPKYLYQDANNMADNETKLQMNAVDNETSRLNNQNTVNAQIYGHDMDYQGKIDTANINAETQYDLAQLKHEQQMALQSGQVKSVETGTDGNTYLVYADGRIEKALDGIALGKNGNPPNSQKHAPQIAELQGMNSTIEQSIKSIDRALTLSEHGLYDGYVAEDRADFMGNFGGTEESRRTQEYQNIVTNLALQSLKAVFGGSPTEGERQMLLKVQASASYPAPVRKAILEEAKAMAQAKLQSNQQQMQTLGYKGGQTVANPFSNGRPSVNSFFE